MNPKELEKNKLIKELFNPPIGPSQISIEKARGKIGRKQYDWLIKYVGAAKKGKNADVVERNGDLIHIPEFLKSLRITEDTLKLPTASELEGIKKTRQFRRASFLLAYFSAILFFYIALIPDKLWWLKIVSLLVGAIIIWILNCAIFAKLEEID